MHFRFVLLNYLSYDIILLIVTCQVKQDTAQVVAGVVLSIIVL